MTSSKSSLQNFSIRKEGLLPKEEMIETGKKQKQLIIGVPKETDVNESRIALTPLSVKLLVDNGHQVLIEKDAGKVANFFNRDYSEAGAIICDKAEEVYKCDVILKIAPLSNDEILLLKENQIIFSALNLTNQKEENIVNLMSKKPTCFAFDFIKDENNCFPIVRSMSEIAGSTSILIASEYLSNAHGGKGEMLGGITGVNPSEVVILGAGTAAEYAARTALGLGALVKVFDNSIFKLRILQNNLGQRIYTSILQPMVLSNALKTADVVIGALSYLKTGQKFYVTEDVIRTMKNGSVIIDISIDQGGCFETSAITSHNNPVFNKHNVVHYCVPNIASRVARTASYALSNIFTPILLNLSESGGAIAMLKDYSGLRQGVYIFNGILTNNKVGKYFNLSSQDINLLMAAF